jgi:catechol 2,3-dioxygenase-like lactoylglutathione lyase family enzyme
MIDHIGLPVADLDASVAFYTRALAPLGYELVKREAQFAGFGVAGKGYFWIGAGKPIDRIHVALRARGRAEVRAFHAAAIAAGGKDNGPPGVRDIYHPSYYGAFIHDPDGHNIEAVCHDPYLD